MPFFGFGKKKKKEDDAVATKRSESKISQRDEEMRDNASAIKRSASQREVRNVERNVEILVRGSAEVDRDSDKFFFILRGRRNGGGGGR